MDMPQSVQFPDQLGRPMTSVFHLFEASAWQEPSKFHRHKQHPYTSARSKAGLPSANSHGALAILSGSLPPVAQPSAGECAKCVWAGACSAGTRFEHACAENGEVRRNRCLTNMRPCGKMCQAPQFEAHSRCSIMAIPRSRPSNARR